MNDTVVEFFDPAGNEIRYRRYAARLPEFLAKYPPKEGYRVECEMTDLLSLQQGRLALLREAVSAGKKPSDVGLPGLERDVNTLVCTARLLNSQGQVVRTASASKAILDFKDYEVLETAANQRLLAALGFGGDVFNEDEDADLRGQGLSLVPDSGGGGADAVTSANAQPPAFPLAPDSPTETAGPTAARSADGEVPAALRRQVENLARRLGEEVPVLKTAEDANAALRRLGEAERRRRTASAA